MPETAAQRESVVKRFGLTVHVGDYTFKGIYDAPYVEQFGGAGQAKQLTMQSVDIASASLVDEVAITIEHDDGVCRDYTARVPQPDGTGWTIVSLADA